MNETYRDYIRNLETVYLARMVKIADLEDNLNIADLGHALTKNDSKRITKYIEAINYLRGMEWKSTIY